jgi:hypothetical protein
MIMIMIMVRTLPVVVMEVGVMGVVFGGSSGDGTPFEVVTMVVYDNGRSNTGESNGRGSILRYEPSNQMHVH